MKITLITSIVLLSIATTTISCNTRNEKTIDTPTIVERIIEVERPGVIKRANEMLKERPITVTDTTCIRSAGSKHDYYSEGTYWWPNPDNPEGEYIRKDGLKNPENFMAHELALRRMAWIVGSQTSAYLLTGEQKFVDAANAHLKAWFVDTVSMMSPHLLYAQAIKGQCTGRGIGIIDATHLIEVAKSVSILEKSPYTNRNNVVAIKAWFSAFLNWLHTHPYGVDEMHWKNNHGTWWHAQASAYAILVNDNQILDTCRRYFRDSIMPMQMAANGSFPLEIERTKPFGYSLFNIDGMTVLVNLISDTNHDYWNFTLDDGRNIRKGIDFICPYVENKQTWPYKKDIARWDEQPGRHPFLYLAALAFNEPKYVELWQKNDATFKSEEGKRNAPLKNAILWLNLPEPSVGKFKN